MDENDPISQIFPDQEDVNLYEVLNLSKTASQDEIRKVYRRLALIYHPDKHATAGEEAKATASAKFQQIGFAYAVLSDEKRKERYDKTGSTTEGLDLAPGEDGWEAYFEDLFERVTRRKLDEMKKEYQGSLEETEDLKKAYLETKGSIGEILNHIPHSTTDDETRLIVTITKLIKKGELPKMKEWDRSTKDEKARLIRQKESQKEAKEAEALAIEMGVWDEFYGSGKWNKRKGKGKGKGAEEEEEEKEERQEEQEEDENEDGETAALKALIMKRREGTEKRIKSFFDDLEAKYTGETSGKGKKRGRLAAEFDVKDEPTAKKGRFDVYDIPDDEWAVIQEKLFGSTSKTTSEVPQSKDKSKDKSKGKSKDKPKDKPRKKKGRKASAK